MVLDGAIQKPFKLFQCGSYLEVREGEEMQRDIIVLSQGSEGHVVHTFVHEIQNVPIGRITFVFDRGYLGAQGFQAIQSGFLIPEGECTFSEKGIHDCFAKVFIVSYNKHQILRALLLLSMHMMHEYMNA